MIGTLTVVLIGILAVVLIGVAVFAYLAIMADKPTYFRQKEVTILKELAWGLALRYAEGSTLVMGYGERSELIEILKRPDRGEILQEVRFRIACTQLSPGEGRAVAEALSAQGTVFADAWDDEGVTGCWEATIRGAPEEIGADALSIAKAVVDSLRLGSDQRFTFKLAGDMDHRLWKRMNQDTLERWARGSRFERWLARMNQGE